MDELDQQAKQFKSNAEQIEVVCDKLAHLSQDKRKARKTYQEEHTKIAARLNHVSFLNSFFAIHASIVVSVVLFIKKNNLFFFFFWQK